MARQKKRLLFLIRTEKEIIVTTVRPKDVAFDPKRKKWSLRGLPWGKIGDFDKRFYYSDDPDGLIGVFYAGIISQIKNLATCLDWHLRDILGQSRGAMGKIDDFKKPTLKEETP